jgi:cytoskeletal protein RodZ
VTVVAAGLLVIAGLAVAWWPDGRVTPYRPGERGTFQQQVSQVKTVGQGAPLLRSPEQAQTPLPLVKSPDTGSTSDTTTQTPTTNATTVATPTATPAAQPTVIPTASVTPSPTTSP